jgi:hypothetical protein
MAPELFLTLSVAYALILCAIQASQKTRYAPCGDATIHALDGVTAPRAISSGYVAFWFWFGGATVAQRPQIPLLREPAATVA